MRDNKADLLDLAVLQNEITRRAADAGLACQFVDECKTPAFNWDKKTIYVPRFKPPATTEDIDYLRASIIHEIGHSNRTDTIKRMRDARIDMTKPFGQVLNIVEDGAMEREIAGTWLGDAASLGVGHDIHVRKQLESFAKMPKDAKFSDDDKKLNAVYLLGERHRNWDKWSAGTRERLRSDIPAEVNELADQLEAKGFGTRMAKARTTEDVFNVAKAIYKDLFDDEKDPEKDKDSDQNDQGKPEEQKGEGESAAGKGKASEAGAPQDSCVPWQMLTSQENTGTPNSKARIDYSNHVRRYGNGLTLETKITQPARKSCPVPKAPPFIGQLRMLLQAEQKNKFQFGLTSGKLDQRKLAKLALPIVPGSDGWRKVFKKRIPGKKINTAVQIMVDGSGSMSGHKAEIAADAADILCQAFAGPLRIKTAVHGFDASNTNRIYPYKEFAEIVQPGVIASKARGCGFSGNADGDAVLWALGNIIKRPEHRKIIVVLSDGMPSDGTHVIDPGSMLKHAIEAARKRGVQVYGIGIEDSSVKHFYGSDCKVIKNASELPQAIIETLRQKI